MHRKKRRRAGKAGLGKAVAVEGDESDSLFPVLILHYILAYIMFGFMAAAYMNTRSTVLSADLCPAPYIYLGMMMLQVFLAVYIRSRVLEKSTTKDRDNEKT